MSAHDHHAPIDYATLDDHALEAEVSAVNRQAFRH
jgi:RNA polymerase sigma-70 factor (ECF subfamily)